MTAGTKLWHGLNQISPEDISREEAQSCLNALTDRTIGTLRLKHGNTALAYLIGAAGQWSKSLHNYQDNTLLAEYNNAAGVAELYYWRDTDTEWTKITSHTWNGYYKLRSCMHLDKLYFVNGFNRMRYWKNKVITECENDVTGYTVPIAKYIGLHSERMFLAGGGDRPYGVYFSSLNDPSVVSRQLVNPYQVKAWSDSNVIYLDNKEPITGLIVYRGALIVSQWKNLWVLEGISPATFRKIEVESATQKNIGCVCGDTMVVKEGMLYGIDKQCLWATDGNTVKDISTLKIKPTFVSLATKIPKETINKNTDIDDFEIDILNNITPYDNYGWAEIINMHRAGIKAIPYSTVSNTPNVDGYGGERWYAYWNKWIQGSGTSEAIVHGWTSPENIDNNNMTEFARFLPEMGFTFDTGDVFEIGYIWDVQVLNEAGGYLKKWILSAQFQNIVKALNIWVRDKNGSWYGLHSLDPDVWQTGNQVTKVINLAAQGEIYGIKLALTAKSDGAEIGRVYCLAPYREVAGEGTRVPTRLTLKGSPYSSYAHLLQANMHNPAAEYQPVPAIVDPLNIADPPAGKFASVSEAMKAVADNTKPAYIGWEWWKRREEHLRFKITTVYCKWKVGEDVVNPRIQYKDNNNTWQDIATLTPDDAIHEDTFNLPNNPVTPILTEARGIRVIADAFNVGTALTFNIYCLYLRTGIITSPTIYLGNATQAVFNAGFNLASLDKADWGGSGNGMITFVVRGATTEAGLAGATYETITTGQDIFTVLGATYKWIQWSATLVCRPTPTGDFNASYPQLKWVNIDGLLDGALYNQPHSIRFEERLLWGFPDKDIKSYMLIYDRLGNFQKHEDLCNITKFCIFNEELYGAKSINQLVKYDDSSILDNGLPIVLTWKTKTYYSDSTEQWVECVKGFVAVKNNENSSAAMTIKESLTNTITTITIGTNSEPIYPFWFPCGILGSAVNFEISFSGNLEILQLAIELREMKPKEW